MSTLSWEATPVAADIVYYPGRMGGGLLAVGLFLNDDGTSYNLKGKYCPIGGNWPDDADARVLVDTILRSDYDRSFPCSILIDEGGHGAVTRAATLKLPPTLQLRVSAEKDVLYVLNGLVPRAVAATRINAHRWGYEE
jgi:hypothetical protein